jgi:hypothetical protein
VASNAFVFGACEPDVQGCEQAALDYLLHNFVLPARQSEASRGYLDFLPSLFVKSSSDSALFSATLALSLAVHGHETSKDHLLQRAISRYGEALARVNVAIRDPIASRDNGTLMTILLFGLIEVSLGTICMLGTVTILGFS